MSKNEVPYLIMVNNLPRQNMVHVNIAIRDVMPAVKARQSRSS